MKTICKEALNDDLSVEIVEYGKDLYMVRYYIHCDDRYTEYGTYTDLQEAINDFDLDCRRHRIKSAISSVVASRKARGAAHDDLKIYLDHVAGVWSRDSDISQYIQDVIRYEC